MDATTPVITINGRDWPTVKLSDSQLLGIALLAKGGFSEGKAAELWMKTIMNMLPEDARAEFVGEYLDGRYTVAHLQALVNELIAALGLETAQAAPTVTAAPAAKKTARKKPAPRKRA